MGMANYASFIPESISFRGVDLGDIIENITIDLGADEKLIKAVNRGNENVGVLHKGFAPIIIVTLLEPAKSTAIRDAIFPKLSSAGVLDGSAIEPGHMSSNDSSIYGTLIVTPAKQGATIWTFPKAVPSWKNMREWVFDDEEFKLKIPFNAIYDEATSRSFITSNKA